MRSSWRESTWGDEVILNYGKALRNYSSLRGKFRVFGANGPVGWHNEYLSEGPGVILGRKGAYRGVNYSKSPFYVIDTAYFLEPKTPMNMQWLYYNVIYSKLGEIDDGSPIPSTTRAAVYSKKIYVPPYSEQSEIGDFLSKFDDKIELNRKMNETLEQMAQAVFQDWFVDFGPVKRKAKGITDPVAILGGLIPDPIKAQEIASLFPDQFAEDGLPEGWVQSKLGHEFNVTMGQSPPGSTYNEINEGLPFFQGRRDFGFRFPKNRVYCNKPSRIAEKDWTLVSVRAPVGDINRSHEKSCIGRGVSTLIHKSGLTSYTYYYALALRRVFENYNSNGTVFGSINKKQLEDITILAPNLSIVQTFDDLITGVDQLILNNTDQNHTLAEMRDLLLPKLMSGEISVDELEKKMGVFYEFTFTWFS